MSDGQEFLIQARPGFAAPLAGLPEAMWVVEVEMLGPFVVEGDGTGACLAAPGIEKLPDNVLKRTGRSVTTW